MNLLNAFNERQEKSKLEYGTELHSNNGRNPLVDAIQEKFDCCIYLRQSIQDVIDQNSKQWRISERFWIDKEPAPVVHVDSKRIIDLVLHDLKYGYKYLFYKEVPSWMIYLYKIEIDTLTLLFNEIFKMKEYEK